MTDYYTTLWIGTTHGLVDREDDPEYPAYEHQVSDGPAGERSESFDFTDSQEAFSFACEHADFVVIEEDFRP